MATSVKPTPKPSVKNSPILKQLKQVAAGAGGLTGGPPEGLPAATGGLPPILQNKDGQPLGGAEPALPQVRSPLKPKSSRKGKAFGFLKG